MTKSAAYYLMARLIGKNLSIDIGEVGILFLQITAGVVVVVNGAGDSFIRIPLPPGTLPGSNQIHLEILDLATARLSGPTEAGGLTWPYTILL